MHHPEHMLRLGCASRVRHATPEIRLCKQLFSVNVYRNWVFKHFSSMNTKKGLDECQVSCCCRGCCAEGCRCQLWKPSSLTKERLGMSRCKSGTRSGPWTRKQVNCCLHCAVIAFLFVCVCFCLCLLHFGSCIRLCLKTKLAWQTGKKGTTRERGKRPILKSRFSMHAFTHPVETVLPFLCVFLFVPYTTEICAIWAFFWQEMHCQAEFQTPQHVKCYLSNHWPWKAITLFVQTQGFSSSTQKHDKFFS